MGVCWLSPRGCRLGVQDWLPWHPQPSPCLQPPQPTGMQRLAGHTAGPFPSPLLPNFVVNLLGAVPKKKSGKWRLTLHLSHPPEASINDGINIDEFPLHYSTVYDVMDTVMQLGRGAIMAKVDIKVPLPLCWQQLRGTTGGPPSGSISCVITRL